MLVMAMEVTSQISGADPVIKDYHFKDVTFMKALVIPATPNSIEVQITLQHLLESPETS
jgi:hypothetical protein